MDDLSMKATDTPDDTGTIEEAAGTMEASALLTTDSKPPNSTNYTSIRMNSQPMSKHRHWKNLIGLATAFMLTMSVYGSLQNLQSSLNFEGGLGLASLVVIHGCLMLSCLIAPAIIRTVGAKWTIVVSLTCYTFYTAANFSPRFYTLIPTAALLGFAAGPLWAAQGTYLTTLAISLAHVVNDVPETVINQFNGFFFLFYQSNEIWGNLLSSVIFSVNATKERQTNESSLLKCGSNGVGKEGLDYLDPGESRTKLLLVIYMVVGLLGVVVAVIAIDRIRSNFPRLPEKKYLAIHLQEVFRLVLTPYISLLIPMMIYCGFEQAYITGDFTKSFVSCTIGIRKVGYVMIVYGVADAISSFIIGRVEVCVGRKLIFTSGGVVNVIVIVWMLLWKPHPGMPQGLQLYLMVICWGYSDAVWQTQISSILGVLLPQSQEAAFANFRFWQAVGFVVSFGVSISGSVLVRYKLYTLLILLLMAMLLYYLVEFVIRNEGL